MLCVRVCVGDGAASHGSAMISLSEDCLFKSLVAMYLCRPRSHTENQTKPETSVYFLLGKEKKHTIPLPNTQNKTPSLASPVSLTHRRSSPTTSLPILPRPPPSNNRHSQPLPPDGHAPSAPAPQAPPIPQPRDCPAQHMLLPDPSQCERNLRRQGRPASLRRPCDIPGGLSGCG